MNKNQRLGQIKNLIMLAVADGRADEAELAIIAAIATREGLSFDEVNEVIEHPERFSISIPADEETKRTYLRDMIALMLADGDITQAEHDICRVCATALGFRSSDVDNLIIELMSELNNQEE